MNFCRIYVVLCCLLSHFMSAAAQGDAVNATGSIDKNINVSRFYASLSVAKGISKAQASSMKQSAARQLEIIYQVAALNPPSGFNAHCTFSFQTASGPDNLMPACEVRLNLTPLIHDRKTGSIRPAPSSYSAVMINSNGLEKLYYQSGSYCKDCSDLHLPVFFEEIAIADSTADYIELGHSDPDDQYNVNNEPVRIIRRNSKPLFVPLTRKELMQYLIAKEDLRISNLQKAITDEQKNIQQSQQKLAHPSPYLNAEMKKVIADDIERTKKNIAKENGEIQQLQQSVQHYRELTVSMPPQESTSPVRITGYASGVEDDFDRLVPAGRHEGKGLYKINPEYYDRSPGAPAIQLMRVSYLIPYSGTSSNAVGRKTVDIFYQLDYHALKESMQ